MAEACQGGGRGRRDRRDRENEPGAGSRRGLRGPGLARARRAGKPRGRLEAEDDPAGELVLVRVLRVPDRVAAPVGVAPVALGVRLDVRGRPASLETKAELGVHQLCCSQIPERLSDSR